MRSHKLISAACIATGTLLYPKTRHAILHRLRLSTAILCKRLGSLLTKIGNLCSPHNVAPEPVLHSTPAVPAPPPAITQPPIVTPEHVLHSIPATPEAPEIVQQPIASQTDIGAQNRQDRKPLQPADRHTSPQEVAQLIASIKAESEQENLRRNWTPLHEAASLGRLEKVQALVQSGASVEARDNERHTPLHLAAQRGHREVVQVLIAAGANINIQNRYQQTPLHLAAQSGHRAVVQTLIAAGAHIEAQDHYYFHETPLHYAANRGHREVVQTLIAAGAHIEAQGLMNRTPLHRAAETGSLEVVHTLLISAHANIAAGDNVGEDTPTFGGSRRAHSSCSSSHRCWCTH